MIKPANWDKSIPTEKSVLDIDVPTSGTYENWILLSDDPLLITDENIAWGSYITVSRETDEDVTLSSLSAEIVTIDDVDMIGIPPVDAAPAMDLSGVIKITYTPVTQITLEDHGVTTETQEQSFAVLTYLGVEHYYPLRHGAIVDANTISIPNIAPGATITNVAIQVNGDFAADGDAPETSDPDPVDTEITKTDHGITTEDLDLYKIVLDTDNGPIIAKLPVITDTDVITVKNIGIGEITVTNVTKTLKALPDLVEFMTDTPDSDLSIDGPVPNKPYVDTLDDNIFVTFRSEVEGALGDGYLQKQDNNLDKLIDDDTLGGFGDNKNVIVQPYYFVTGPDTPTNPGLPSNLSGITNNVSIHLNSGEIKARQNMGWLQRMRLAGENQELQMELLAQMIAEGEAEWNALTAAEQAASLARARQSYMEFWRSMILHCRDTDTIAILRPGTGTIADSTFAIIRANDPNRATLIRAHQRAGYLLYTGAEAKALISPPSGLYMRTLGLGRVVSSSVARAEALAARWGRTVATVGGLFLFGAVESGFVALTFTEQMPLGAVYRQGRLQLRNNIAVDDLDVQYVGPRIYYTPINIDNPGEAQISMRTLKSTWRFGQDREWQFKLCDISGNVPYLDANAASPLPFTVDSGNVGHGAVIAGRPFDIFICAPAEMPAGGTYPNTGYFQGLGQLLSSPVPPTNEGILPRSPEQLPRMFYLNWATNDKRRIQNDAYISSGNLAGHMGHELVYHPKYGWCMDLGTRYTCTESDAAPEAACFIYVGTAIADGNGFVINVPGCRLLWNGYNRLPYNDFRLDLTRFHGINRGRSGFLDYIAGDKMITDPADVDIYLHQYVNPGLPNQWMFTHPNSGRLKTGICGSIGVGVYHESMDGTVSRVAMTNGVCSSPGGATYGNVDCSYKGVDLTALSRPTGAEPKAGLNEIQVRTYIDPANEPLRKQYSFIGTATNYYYLENYGAVVDAAHDDLAAVQALFDGELVADECSDPSGRGFGMQGDC